ncbi:MAG: hypothetical protein JO249_16610 [Acidobacteria bacterium]|nr:hypothetical protein [Acidobacteriota bacterium]
MANNSFPSKNRRNGKTATAKNGHNALYSLPILYRGIYNRVADKVGCDPSYVSRVARGERSSSAVARALENEIRHTMMLSTRHLQQRLPRGSGSRA